MTRIRLPTLSYHSKCYNFSLESFSHLRQSLYMPRGPGRAGSGRFLGLTQNIVLSIRQLIAVAGFPKTRRNDGTADGTAISIYIGGDSPQSIDNSDSDILILTNNSQSSSWTTWSIA